MKIIRSMLRSAVTTTTAGQILRLVAGKRATVLMYHRFANEQNNWQGMPPAVFKSTLRYLQRSGHKIVSIRTLIEKLESGSDIGGHVAITVDDGYADFAQTAQPLLSEFEAPCTLFVTTGPVDRDCWFWWDQIDYVTKCAKSRRHASVWSKQHSLALAWDNEQSRLRSVGAACEQLKLVPTEDRVEMTRQLAEFMDVPLPSVAPPEYASMTWEQVRACERAGTVIGAHTVTHPILAQCSDAQSALEVRNSLERLRSECAGPIDTFAYPNGFPRDYGAREMRLLVEHGVRIAFGTQPGYLNGAYLSADSTARMRIPRYPGQCNVASTARILFGLSPLSRAPDPA